MKAVLLITSGSGPIEARQFVALLADRLAGVAESAGAEVTGRTIEGAPSAPRSVLLHLEGSGFDALGAERGSHALLAASPTRSKRSRKRWFASVELLPCVQEPASCHPSRERDWVVRACRAGGPGGQNVNRRETAVRVSDPQTGLCARAQEYRSRDQNRRAALGRLRAKLEARCHHSEERTRGDLRTAQLRVTRGGPVRVYRLTRDSRLDRVGGSTADVEPPSTRRQAGMHGPGGADRREGVRPCYAPAPGSFEVMLDRGLPTMNAAATFAYRQPFANPRLDSVAAANLAASEYRPTPVFSITAGGPSAQDRPPIEWLLGHDDRIVVVSNYEYSVVDCVSRRTIVSAGITQGWAAFSPDGDRYFVKLGASIVERGTTWPASPDQRESTARALEEGLVRAFYATGDDVLLALSPAAGSSQPAAGSSQKVRTTVLRKRLGTGGAVLWEKQLNGASERLPVLDDGTFVLPMLDGIHTIRPDGSELPVFALSPVAGLLSVDCKGTLFGYELKGSEPSLVLWSLGTKMTVAVPMGMPVQPPVLLRDGRIVAVSASRVVCLESLRPAWTHEVPEGNALVTATHDGELVLRAGSAVKRINANGLAIWTGTVPGGDAIRSNPLLTSDGRIYVATATTIHAFFP